MAGDDSDYVLTQRDSELFWAQRVARPRTQRSWACTGPLKVLSMKPKLRFFFFFWQRFLYFCQE